MSQMRFQTVERDSLFTRLDFRSKLLNIVVISTVAVVWESPLALATLALILIAVSVLVGVKAGYIKMILKLMAPFYVLLLLTHGFWNTTQVKALIGRDVLTPLFVFPTSWRLIGGGSMSLEGFLYGLAVIFKTLILVLVLPISVFTTDASNMIVGLVQARVPYKLVFVFSSALRFIPLLFDEMTKIIEAQRLRGLELERMSLLRRVRVYGKVAVPLILGALVKSQQLEVVLQSRAFTGSSERTYLHKSTLQRADHVAIALLALFLLVAVVLYIWQGVGRFGWLIFP